jgi:hypothetical protein
MRRIQIPTLLAALAFSSFALGRMTNREVDGQKVENSSVERQLKALDRQWLEASSHA